MPLVHENPILCVFDPEVREYMLKRIALFLSLINAKKIVLIDHFNCKAYKKQGYEFLDFSEEVKKHQEINERVIDLLKRMFNVEVELKLIKINEDDSCEWFELN